MSASAFSPPVPPGSSPLRDAPGARRPSAARPRFAVACVEGGERHAAPAGHPECTERLRACMAGLTMAGLWPHLRRLERRRASDAELRLAHSAEHLARLKAAVAKARRTRLVWLPRGTGPQAEEEGDTFVTGTSLEAARFAVGGLLALVDAALCGKCLRGMAFCRPPGHHAGAEGSEGFCLVNNVAVAARYALAKYPKEVRRVMILDWDVHHGQGTQEIFWRDGHVLTVSCHAHAERFYPQSGRPEEVGEDAGRGYNVNVALPAGYTDACLQHAFAEVVLPALRSFAPDLVLVSCGFDHLAGDPLGVGQCSAEGLARLAAEVARCAPRLALALEGGYDFPLLAEGVGCLVRALTERPPRPLSAKPPPCAAPLPASAAAVRATRRAHAGLPLRLAEPRAFKRRRTAIPL